MPTIVRSEFSYMHIKFSFLGNLDVKGVQSITYKVKRESPNLYGAGDEPVAFGRGRKEYEGEIKLLRADIFAINQATNGDLTDVAAFDLVLTFADGRQPPVTITLVNVRFLEDGLEGSSGDTELPLTIPIAFTEIRRAAA